MTFAIGDAVIVTSGLAKGRTGRIKAPWSSFFEKGKRIPQWVVNSGQAGDLVPQRILREDYLAKHVDGGAADAVNLTGAE
jgi:hypothetical protein